MFDILLNSLVKNVQNTQNIIWITFCVDTFNNIPIYRVSVFIKNNVRRVYTRTLCLSYIMQCAVYIIYARRLEKPSKFLKLIFIVLIEIFFTPYA